MFQSLSKKSIEEIENYLNEPMIYGTPGNLSEIQSIRLEVDKHNFDILEKTKDVHILAGALKLFFRWVNSYYWNYLTKKTTN